MTRPRVLDVFCGEGGAGMGYHEAGFDVVGVDLGNLRRRYPFPFLRMDALELDIRFLQTFDLVHWSPPCQFGTMMSHAPNAKGDLHPNLIPDSRKLSLMAGVDYVIENVEAPKVRPWLFNPVCLCGSMFGLGCTTKDGTRFQLQRHRLFETNWGMAAPAAGCQHIGPVVGVYGGHVRNRSAKDGGRLTADFPGEDKPALMIEAMGMPWATMNGMSEAIPPAYTRHIGQQFLARRQQESRS